MKEITNSIRQQISETFRAKQIPEKNLSYRIGGQVMEIPLSYISRFAKRMHCYELDSVGDIMDNYNILSRDSSFPLLLRRQATKIGHRYWKNGGMRLWYLEDKTYQDLAGEDNKRINLNFGQIENVSLRNFNFIKEHNFEACEFDVIDDHQDNIRGAFMYKHNPYLEMDDEKSEDLSKLLSLLDSETFDISFQALNQDHVLQDGNPRGKKLLVERIFKHRGEDEVDEENLSPDILKKVFV